MPLMLTETGGGQEISLLPSQSLTHRCVQIKNKHAMLAYFGQGTVLGMRKKNIISMIPLLKNIFKRKHKLIEI